MNKKDRVLILDDVSAFTELIGKSLKHEGIDVVESNNALEALSIITESDYIFDLVITDIDMPNINGFQFIEKLRKMQGYYNVPIVFITAMANATIKLKAYEHDILEVIFKPIEVQSFNARIKSYLNNFRLIKYASFIRSKGKLNAKDLNKYFSNFSKKKLNVIMFLYNASKNSAHIEFKTGDLTKIKLNQNHSEEIDEVDALEKIENWKECSYIIYDSNILNHIDT